VKKKKRTTGVAKEVPAEKVERRTGEKKAGAEKKFRNLAYTADRKKGGYGLM